MEKDKAYAELWMGDHPSAPAKTADGITLHEVPGERDIPFLFKILSIKKPLSLQSHPNRQYAEELFAKQPNVYRDPNPKPEMGLFIKPTLLLYGFREYQEIISNVDKTPELAQIAGEESFNKFKENPSPATLKEFISAIFHHDKNDTLKLVKQFMERQHDYDPLIEKAIQLIYEYFQTDFGPFFPLILNVASQQPGESVYIPTGTLHAYLDGDLFEAMVVSDNVVRAGMTPKLIDVETLLKILNFEPLKPVIVPPVQEKPHLVTYTPPIQDFALGKIELDCNEEVSFDSNKEVIAIVVDGDVEINGKNFKKGEIIFVPRDQPTVCVKAHVKSSVVYSTTNKV